MIRLQNGYTVWLATAEVMSDGASLAPFATCFDQPSIGLPLPSHISAALHGPVLPSTVLVDGEGEVSLAATGIRSAKAPAHRELISQVGGIWQYLLTGTNRAQPPGFLRKLLWFLRRPAPALRMIRPDLPEKLDTLYRRMVTDRAGDRFSSLESLIGELTDAGGEDDAQKQRAQADSD